MEVGHTAAERRAQHVVQKQEGGNVEHRADGSEGEHEPPQRPAGPIPGGKGLFLVHIVPRQNDAQGIVQQVQQQKLQRGHGQKGQKRTGADDGKDVAKVGAGGDLNVLQHIGKGLAAFQNALFQHPKVFLQQHHVCGVLGSIHRRIHRDAHVGLAQGGDVVDTIPQKAYGVSVLLQGRHQPHLLPRGQFCKNVDFLHGSRKGTVGHFVQLRPRQNPAAGDAHPAADGHGNIRLISRENFRGHFQPFQGCNGGSCGLFGGIEKGQIPHQCQILLIGRGDMVGGAHFFLCHGDDLHAVLQHLADHCRNALGGVLFHGQHLSPVGHGAAPGHHMGNVPFQDQFAAAVRRRYKGADYLPGIVKGNFIRFAVLRQQFSEMCLPARHSLAGQQGVVNGVAHPGVVKAVEKSQIQRLGAFVAQHVHVVFQQDALVGQGAGLVHAQHIHAAKALHGVDVLDDGLLAAHGKAAPCQTSGDDHGQHLRHQPHRHRQGKGKGFQPVAPGETQQQKHQRDQHPHKPQHYPCDGVSAFLKGLLFLRVVLGKAAVEGIFAHCHHNALALAANDGGCHKGEIFQLGHGARAAVAEDAAAFFHHRTFPGDGSLREKQVGDSGEPQISRHPIPCRQQHHVSHDQFLRRNVHAHTAPPHPDALMDQPVQLLGGVFGTQFLHQTDAAADENHGKDNEGCGGVLGKIGGQKTIRHQRNAPQHKENDVEGVDKRPPQPPEHGIATAAAEAVGAVFLPLPLHLLRGQTCRGAAQLPVELRCLPVCVFLDAAVKQGGLGHSAPLLWCLDTLIVTWMR